MNTDNKSTSSSPMSEQGNSETVTGETLSRVAEDGGIEPTQRHQDSAEEKDEMRRDADAGAGS